MAAAGHAAGEQARALPQDRLARLRGEAVDYLVKVRIQAVAANCVRLETAHSRGITHGAFGAEGAVKVSGECDDDIAVCSAFAPT